MHTELKWLEIDGEPKGKKTKKLGHYTMLPDGFIFKEKGPLYSIINHIIRDLT